MSGSHVLPGFHRPSTPQLGKTARLRRVLLAALFTVLTLSGCDDPALDPMPEPLDAGSDRTNDAGARDASPGADAAPSTDGGVTVEDAGRGCAPDPIERSCAGVQCGSRTNNCGEIIDCGGCASPTTCTAEGFCRCSTCDTPYAPGNTYYSANDWIEYRAGSLPVIITAPHGGDLRPSTITTRTAERCAGESGGFASVADSNTAELARSIMYRFFEHTGEYPHVIINRLHRSKMDANRDRGMAACGSPNAEMAWDDFHAFIEAAERRVLADHGRGWYLDIHGHAHAIQRLELGYGLTSAHLRESDAALDADPRHRNRSSIRTFVEQAPFAFSDVLRGNAAFGTLLSERGFPSVPSSEDPAPGAGEPYFNGGYNTRTYGCRDGGSICGVQIEAYFTGARDTQANRATFARAITRATDTFLGQSFGISLLSPKGEVVVDNRASHNDEVVARFEAPSGWSSATNNSTKYLSGFRVFEHDGSAGGDDEADGAAFFFWVPAPGEYSIYAWWPQASHRSPSVRYRVYEGEGATRLLDEDVDQRTDGGQWNLLGTWDWTTRGWGKVLIAPALSSPGSIAADAVRVVRH